MHSSRIAARKKVYESKIVNMLVSMGYKQMPTTDNSPDIGTFYREAIIDLRACEKSEGKRPKREHDIDGVRQLDGKNDSFRVDFVIRAFDGTLVLLECDELQHFGRAYACDLPRMVNASSVGSTSIFWLWLRFNPNGAHSVNGIRQPLDAAQRMAELRAKLQSPSMLVAAFPTEARMGIHFLYYDAENTTNNKLIPCIVLGEHIHSVTSHMNDLPDKEADAVQDAEVQDEEDDSDEEDSTKSKPVGNDFSNSGILSTLGEFTNSCVSCQV
jgi:hypothetical protein